jgi:hypothetical protein
MEPCKVLYTALGKYIAIFPLVLITKRPMDIA